MKFEPILTSPKVIVGADLNKWLEIGGGKGLQNAMNAPDKIIEIIQKSDLRGMGGAGFPTYRKWELIAQNQTTEKYVICNGNEDEPGTFKDRFLLRHTPHQVIEGALIALLAIKANHILIYINPHEERAVGEMKLAITQWKQSEIYQQIQSKIQYKIELEVILSSGRYIGGEETSIISTIQDGFPFPRIKPPFPGERGLNDKPTLINNIETLANLPNILKYGAQWYKNLGLGNSSGTKLYSLSGDVLKPGLYELPMGTTLRELIFDYGGGILSDHGFKAVFTGGPSNNLLTKDDLDVPMDFDSLKKNGSALGTGAMIVVSNETSIVRKVAEYVDFFSRNSCGQCPPCKIGNFQLERLLRKIDTGLGQKEDLETLENLCLLLPGGGRCALINGSPNIVMSSMKKFKNEYLNQLTKTT